MFGVLPPDIKKIFDSKIKTVYHCKEKYLTIMTDHKISSYW